MVRAAVGALIATLTLSACASGERMTAGADQFSGMQAAATTTGGSTARVSADHKLGPYDRLRINVFRKPELSVDNAVVDGQGQIVMPLIGPVDVLGKTRDELATALRTELSHDIVNPIVTVTVLEAVTEQVTLNGAVKRPGLFTVSGKATLLQVITLGGGTDINADTRNVLVMRTLEGARKYAKFNLDVIRRGQAEDPEILPGDFIVVENSRVRTMWSQILTSLPVIGMFTTF